IQVIAQHRRRRARVQACPDLSSAESIPVAQDVKDPPLPICQVMTHPVRWHVTAGNEPDHQLAGAFLKLRLGVSRSHTEFHDLLRSSAPAFDETPQVKGLKGRSW